MGERLVRGSRVAYVVAAYAFIVGILVQVLFVGLALFAGQDTWPLHIGWGHTVGTFLLAMLVFAFTGRLPRNDKILTAALFVLYLVQAEVFSAVRNVVPLFAAFHPVLALVIFALATVLAIRGRSVMKGTRVGPGPSGASPEPAMSKRHCHFQPPRERDIDL